VQRLLGAVLAERLERAPPVGLLRQLVDRALDRALERLFLGEQPEHHVARKLPLPSPTDNSAIRRAMPRRTDLDSVLIIGSGPIVIGQACEFDYSGTQACKALREEGLRVVLINSNPATIMTDPELADATYVEPLTVDVLDKVLEREKVKAVLPTLGGQTGLNLAMAAHRAGVLERHGVELIGAQVRSIEMA